jgi:Predicted S-adenosylmethionine-dependent methyltransferase involved in cell envelope biogenesis
MLTRKPILPGEGELEENSPSKSAKLRVFERGLGSGLETINWQKEDRICRQGENFK